MTQRSLYLERADRGDLLVGLRLVGPRTADAWHAPKPRGLDDAIAAVRDAAAWTRERLLSGDRATLATICLDPDGSLCSWLTSASQDPTILSAIARGAGDAHHADHDDAAPAPPGSRALDHFGTVGAGMSIQALTAGVGTTDPTTNGHATRKAKGPEAAARRRLAILGVTDSAPAMLIDALDQMGIAPGSVITLWHAMARAWDPAARQADQTPRADRLVAEDSPVTAIVLVEPGGRLTWAWSRDAELLTGGSMRLPRARAHAHAGGEGARPVEGASLPRLEASHAARLAADWLAWSAQTGAAPARVVMITPERLGGMPPQEAASAMVRAWPQATIDLITDDDPVLFTLQRSLGEDADAAGRAEAGVSDGSIVALTTRPARAHRAMYVWGAAAIAALALVAGAVAVQAWNTASSARARADAKRRETSTLALDHFQDPTAFAPGIILSLEDELARLQAEGRPADTSEFRPVMQEVETISLVTSSLIASSPQSKFISLSVDNALPTRLILQLPDLGTYEHVRDALRDAGVSDLVWSENPTRNERPNPAGGTMLETTFIATWRTTPAPGATGGTP